MKEFDYNFQETLNLLYCCCITSELKKERNKIVSNLSKKVCVTLDKNQKIEFYKVELCTSDKEILQILTQNNKDIKEIIKDILDLNECRLKTRKAFHRYIERYCNQNAEYNEYQEIYEKYCCDIYKFKLTALDIIISLTNEYFEKKAQKELFFSFKELGIKEYEYKVFISNLFENSIDETWNAYDTVTKEDDRDYSQLNILDGLRTLWVKSIRDKQNNDTIIKNFNDNILLYKNDKNKYLIKNLPLIIAQIAKAKPIKGREINVFIIKSLFSIFKDVKTVKSLCVNGHDDVKPLMDKGTFNTKLKTIEKEML